jgi:quinol monooxygenase YgiN
MNSGDRIGGVTCQIVMRFAASEVDPAVRLLLSTVGRTEAKEECRSCSVARDAIERGQIRYNEVWDSESAFGRHVGSEEFRRVLVAMDMCCEEPSVTFGTFSGRTGIAQLRSLRDRSEREPERDRRKTAAADSGPMVIPNSGGEP